MSARAGAFIRGGTFLLGLFLVGVVERSGVVLPFGRAS